VLRDRPAAFITGGVRIDAVSIDDAVGRLLTPGAALTVHLCNAYTVALASKDGKYLQTVNGGDLNLADGMPLVWIAKRLGLRGIDRRVYGPELMGTAIERGQQMGTRHFLYGSTPEVLDGLKAEISARWPAAMVVGATSPPFRPITDNELRASMETIDNSGADIVWVGMGTPKQDELVARMGATGSHNYVAIGAAFDFIAGAQKQAPLWMQNSGFEWLYRLAREPRRLWRRYLLGNTRFIWVNLRRRPVRVRAEQGSRLAPAGSPGSDHSQEPSALSGRLLRTPPEAPSRG
jgi:exopolysaccharide biosynthesis WecB/TagA/CpsF family protein